MAADASKTVPVCRAAFSYEKRRIAFILFCTADGHNLDNFPDIQSNAPLSNSKIRAGNTVQEIAVMRNKKNRFFAVFQKIRQPFNGINIKVIGRLIQQKQVCII